MERPELDERQRTDAARIHEAVIAGPAPTPSALREISSDRIVLGEVLGDYLHRVVGGTQADTISLWPVLELLRAAGADEQRAAARAAWLRQDAGERKAV